MLKYAFHGPIMSDWKRQQGISASHDSASVVVTKYTVPVETAKEVKKAGSVYGSQGRALQVATEMLIRMENPPPPKTESGREPPALVRISLRLHKRTFELIRSLSRVKYNDDPGQVVSACVKVLKMKRIKL